MIRSIQHENSRLWFVADDMGIPVSYGYLTESQAEEVEQLIADSDGQASIPRGVDVEAILKDSRSH